MRPCRRNFASTWVFLGIGQIALSAGSGVASALASSVTSLTYSGVLADSS